jgi:biotin carboxylase
VKPSVLIACASEWASPARLPRVLARAGARVTAFAAPGRPLRYTRFVHRHVRAPEPLDAFVAALRAHLAATGYDAVLIADDPLLTALAARRDEAWLDGVLPIARTHPWSRALASKAAFVELGAAAGLPIPPSRVCRAAADAHAAARELGYPFVLKQSSGFAGLGVRLVRDDAELTAAWDALAPGDAELVAQRYVDGPIGNSVVYFHRGTPACWMSAFKTRTWPGPFGPSAARRFMHHDDVAPLLARVGALTGYHGFGALDWVLDASGRLQLIELNARPVPTIHMAPLAGVDFARAFAESLAGTPSRQVPPAPPPDAPVYPMFPEDVWRAASEKALRLGDLLPRPGRFTDLPWADPGLLFWHARRFAQVALSSRS